MGHAPSGTGITNRVQLAQIARTGEMGAEACLGTAGSHAAQGPQHTRQAEHADSDRPGEHWRQAIKNHGRVVEDIGRQPVHFAFRLESASESVGEQDRRYSPCA